MIVEHIIPKDIKCIIEIPQEYINKEIEIIIKPKNEKIEEDYEFWSEEEIKNIGKIGLISSSFEDDKEDYSKW